MKKIAIIGAGISGLFFANLFKENQNYKITIFEKKKINRTWRRVWNSTINK